MFVRFADERVTSRTITVLAFLAGVGIPSISYANAGTPLMWATMLHMVFGNACIGWLEGALLAYFFRVSSSRAIGLMILANYFSAWIGWIWLSGFLGHRDNLNLYNVWPRVWELVFAAYIVTLVLEWPFVVGCLWKTKKVFCRSCVACFFVQSVSYILLFGWYGLASVNSLYSQMSIVPIEQMSLPANIRIYFISDHDGNVYRRGLDSDSTEKVFDLNSTDSADCLSIQKSLSLTNFEEIVVLLESGNFNTPKILTIDVAVPDDDCPRSEDRSLMTRDRFQSPSPIRSYAPKLGSAIDSPWKFRSRFWPGDGLTGENSKTGAHIRFAIETPFIEWEVRHAILLPSNHVLFQLGKRQICILEPDTRKVAVLCFGRGAVAVLERPESTARAAVHSIRFTTLSNSRRSTVSALHPGSESHTANSKRFAVEKAW
jgi:hypothetical protein